jgi:hypothetical protein
MVLINNKRHKLLYGTMSKGMVSLMQFWYEKPKQAMDDYLKQEEN